MSQNDNIAESYKILIKEFIRKKPPRKSGKASYNLNIALESQERHGRTHSSNKNLIGAQT